MWDRYNVGGQQAMTAGKHADAEKSFRMAVDEARGFGPKDSRLATSLNNLANCLRAQGKFEEADPVYVEAIRAKEQAEGAFCEGLTSILDNYAKMLRAAGREKEAEKHERRSRGIFAMKK